MKVGLLTLRLDRKDTKAYSIIWGFVLIFLMGVIGSNLMLLTHTNYHAELQRTLTTTPILPVAIGMMTTAFFHKSYSFASGFSLGWLLIRQLLF